ncbi:MAG: transcriptional repressor PurR, partial [Rhodocyclaceae bacterium]|nr:transcriptional repressor PurR [Rhodocyclaceae bacterium]
RIACITGPNDLSPSMQRVEGYYRAMAEFKLAVNPEYVTTGDFRFLGGEQAMEKLLTCQPRPDAVFILNDMMAIGAMTAIRRAGLSIPADISIVGFDDIELASAVTPSLTTIAQPIAEIARQATDLLIQRLVGSRKGVNQRITLQAALVKRESSARKL